MTYFSGRVHSVVFENPKDAFYVFRMVLDDSTEKITVRGNVLGLNVSTGSWFGFEGRWVNHPTYGNQISISRAPVFNSEWDPDTAEKTLVSQGVGELLCRKVRSYLGDNFIEGLADLDTLESVPGVTKFSAIQINTRWKSINAYFKTLNFLSDLNIPKGKISRIWSHFGDSAEEVLSRNPWQLVEIDGISFSVADSIANRLNLPKNCIERVIGCVLYSCKAQKNLGHLYLQSGQLFSEVSRNIPGVAASQVAAAIAHCHQNKLLVVDKKTRPGTTAIYEPWFHKVESEGADLIASRRKTAGFSSDRRKDFIQCLSNIGPKTEKEASKKRPSLKKVIKTAVSEWGAVSKLVLTDKQEEGVRNALEEPISVITGLPGTGKTTSLRILVKVLQETGIPYLLLAPTGIAAKRLASVTGSAAYTIHRAFEAKNVEDEAKREATYMGVVGDSKSSIKSDGSGEAWGYSDAKHPAEIVVVDESSMLDQSLLYRILVSTSEKCRLVFVGDAAQLPPVGPGNVLRDLVNSKVVPVVALTDIFRQEDTSDIVYAAHEIHRGRTPKVENPSDFSLVPLSDESDVLNSICKISDKLYSRRENFQILSPRHAGTVGVTSLNTRLRDLLNPKVSGLQEVRVGQDTMREGDRIMVIKNNYKLKVYNGDVGKISRINIKLKEVEVKIHGVTPIFITFSFKEVPVYLRLAYACTVHKAQGLEYEYIVMPIVESFGRQLQRNLLYTAITRASKKVILVGTKTALSKAIANDNEDQRNTLFLERLLGPQPSNEG